MRISSLLNPYVEQPPTSEENHKKNNLQPRAESASAVFDGLTSRKNLEKNKQTNDADKDTSSPAFLVLDFKPKPPISEDVKLLSAYLQNGRDPKKKYKDILNHYIKWCKESKGSRKTLADLINSEMHPKDHPDWIAWRKSPKNPYVKEGYIAFTSIREYYGKKMETPPPKKRTCYDTIVEL